MRGWKSWADDGCRSRREIASKFDMERTSKCEEASSSWGWAPEFTRGTAGWASARPHYVGIRCTMGALFTTISTAASPTANLHVK